MTVDVYIKDDIINVLKATFAAGNAPIEFLAEFAGEAGALGIPLEVVIRIFQAGYNSGLAAGALAFGANERSVEACPKPYVTRFNVGRLSKPRTPELE